MRQMRIGDVQGRCEPRFEPLRAAVQRALDGGDELGLSVSVFLEGQQVVDLWGGWMDTARTQPWHERTITNVWSTTKIMTALTALVLVDRGLLDLYAPVSRYWPEFAANGKERIEVRHVLSHSSGVSGLDQPAKWEDLCDHRRAAARMATQAPWWEPGTASGYHALSQGHLIGELVERITGQTLGRFFAQEIAGPLGADFHIGLAPPEFGRVADIVPPPPLPFDLSALDPRSPAVRTLTGPVADAAIANTELWRQAEIPAANGHGNARSVALIQSIVSHGGEIHGVRLLSPSTIDLIFKEQARGVDLVLGVPLRWGMGYGLPELATVPYIPDRKVCFWGGWGGSIVINDLDARMTFAYMMNKMAPGVIGSPRSEVLVRAAYACLG